MNLSVCILSNYVRSADNNVQKNRYCKMFADSPNIIEFQSVLLKSFISFVVKS